MKTVLRKMKDSGLFLFVVMLLCSLFGITGVEAMTADAIGAPAPEYGDQILDENGVVIDGLIDLTDASEKAPELISKHFVQEIIRVDPYAYPTMAILKANYHWRKKERPHYPGQPRIDASSADNGKHCNRRGRVGTSACELRASKWHYRIASNHPFQRYTRIRRRWHYG